MKKTYLFFAVYVLFAQFAYGLGGAQPGTESPLWLQFVPLILVFAIFFFLLILPQQKREKRRRAMLSALKKNDDVLTSSGIYGKIQKFSDDQKIAHLEIADKVVIRVAREQITQNLSGIDAKAKDAKEPKDRKE